MKELSSQVVRIDQRYERQTYVAGAHSELGQVLEGWTGTETLIKKTVVKPIRIFEVNERKGSSTTSIRKKGV